MQYKREAWPPTFDQEGNEITQQMVSRERILENLNRFESRKEEFESRMEAFALSQDEPFGYIGWNSNIQAHLYQYGFGVYAVEAHENGLTSRLAGQVG